MPPEPKQANKPKRTGRTVVLTGLLAAVAAVAAWLSNCIPGFGIGEGEGEGQGDSKQVAESEPVKAAEAEPEAETGEGGQAAAAEGEPTVRKPAPLKLTIDARGCIFEAGQPIDCTTICDRDELWADVDSVIIDATNGPHGVVMDVLDCLKAKKLAVSIKRK